MKILYENVMIDPNELIKLNLQIQTIFFQKKKNIKYERKLNNVSQFYIKLFLSERQSHNKVPTNWSAAINGCSLPIDSQMVGALQFETR